MTTTRNRHRRRARLGLAALGATVAGLAMAGGTAGATTPPPPYGSPIRPPVTLQLDPDVVHIDSLVPSRSPAPILEKIELCVRDINGTLTIVPPRLCP